MSIALRAKTALIRFAVIDRRENRRAVEKLVPLEISLAENLRLQFYDKQYETDFARTA